MNIYIYPTDTVWGLGASIYDFQAHLRIAEIKKTPTTKPISVLMPTLDDVKEYFKFPRATNFELLKEIFSLEVTLGLPVPWLQKEIPDYIFVGSSWVGVRCLELASLQGPLGKTLGPITTTSLNYTGEAPILSENLAQEFAKENADCTFIPSDPTDPPMSGQASCLIYFDESGTFKLIRPGRYSEKIQKLVQRLF